VHTQRIIRSRFQVPILRELEKTVSPKVELGSQSVSEGMTSSIAKVLAMGLKRKVIGVGNQVESATDLEKKINLLSKQINVIAGLVLTTISVSDEKGLLSKGAILTSLFSSHEPDINNIDLDTLFEGEI